MLSHTLTPSFNKNGGFKGFEEAVGRHFMGCALQKPQVLPQNWGLFSQSLRTH